MKNAIFYHKRTGQPVQIIARAQTKPTFQEVICYQELTNPYDHYVMEKRQFFAEYVNKFEELPLVGRKQLTKREDLPDKQPRISKGEISEEPVTKDNQVDDVVAEDSQNWEEAVQENPQLQKLIEFFDAESFHDKMKLFEKMEDDLDEHMLNNIAVSLDLPLEDGVDIAELIKSELRIRSRYEGERGDRL